jgi:hypothetical protein
MSRLLSATALLVLVAPAAAQPKPREVLTTPGMFFSLHASPDGSLVAVHTVRIKLDKDGKPGGDGNEVIVVEAATGKVRFNTGQTDLSPLGFTEKSLVLGGRAGFGETHVQHWDLETGKADTALVLMKEAAHPVLSADAKTVTTVTKSQEAVEHTVETWDAATGKSAGSFKLDAVKTRGFRQVADGPFLAVVPTAKGIGLLSRNAKTGKSTTAELPGVTTASISADGKWVIGRGDQGFRLFDAAGKQKWAVAAKNDGYPFGVTTKYVVSTDGFGKVHLLDLATGKPVRTLDAQSRGVTAWALSPDGKTLYVAGAKGQAVDLNSVQAFELGKK